MIKFLGVNHLAQSIGRFEHLTDLLHSLHNILPNGGGGSLSIPCPQGDERFLVLVGQVLGSDTATYDSK